MYTISHNAITNHAQDIPFLKPGDVTRELFCEYSTIPNVMYPWDPAVLRAIRSFDGDAVPATVKRVLRTPAGSDVSFLYFALLRRSDSPLVPHEPIVVRMGHGGATAASPNIEDLILEGETPPWAEKQGLPGKFVPMTWDLYYRCKRAYKLSQRTAEQIAKDYLEGLQKAEHDKWKGMKSEMDYRFDHDYKHLKNNVDALSGNEYDSIGQRREREKKPMVFLGN